MLGLYLLACTAPDSARMAWVRDTLVNENVIWQSRAPELLAGKYARMAADPYDYMRGTAGLFYSDLARPDTDRAPTAFLTVPEASLVLIAGDPHPENFSTTPGPDGDRFGIEAVDLDAAAFGAWTTDTRRAALGLVTLIDALEGCGCEDDAVAAFAFGYADEIDARRSGGPGWDNTANDGDVFTQLRENAIEDVGEAKLLNKVSTLAEGQRTFLLDEAVDDEGKGILALTDVEAAQFDRVVAGWPAPEGLRILDVARRFGSGISSFPAVRFAVLWDLGDDGPDDDALINIREVVDPPSIPGRNPTVPVLFRDNASRIEEVAWMLWSAPNADPLMAGVPDGGQSFKVTGWGDDMIAINHGDIAEVWNEGGLAPADIVAFGDALGHLLAGSHARGLTAEGGSAVAAIGADLDAAGGAAVLAEERVTDAQHDSAQQAEDYALFLEALTLYGEVLGAELPLDDVGR